MALAPAAGLAAPTNTPPGPGDITPPVTPNQPNQSCELLGNQPGMAGSSSNTGSAFSPNGQAGTVYAGEQPKNQKNTVSVSQYDVACLHNQSNK